MLPPTKKMKTTGGQEPTSHGQEMEPNLKRKNKNKEKKKKKGKSYAWKKDWPPMADTQPFLEGQYARALDEYFKKRGYVVELKRTIEKHESNTPEGKKFWVCKYKAIVSASGDAKSKEQAAREAALGVMKRMELVPRDVDKQWTNGEWQLRGLPGPRINEVTVVKKKKEELLVEREIDEEEKTYSGIVKFWNEVQKFGFISIDEEITFKGFTAQREIYAAIDDIICTSDKVGMRAKSKVVFKIYKDSLGLGAYDVTNEDGSPIFYAYLPWMKRKRNRDKIRSQNNRSETNAMPKKEEIKSINEHKQYLKGNFRGALMEFIRKKYPGSKLEVETTTVAVNGRLKFTAKCKAVGGETEKFKEVVGVGQHHEKRVAVKSSVLSYMFKSKLLTSDQHYKIHPQNKDGSDNGVIL